LIKHFPGFAQDPIIGKPQHTQSLRDHVSVAFLIVMPRLIWIVRRTIAFNYQLGFVTIEVSDVVTKLMLSPKFEPEQLAISQQFPKQFFGRRLLLPQLARAIHQPRKLVPASILSALSHDGFPNLHSFSLSHWERAGRGCAA
jgi:hypothetical protein